jgi:hypothetical protein
MTETTIGVITIICWCNCYAIKSNTLAMVIDIVGADDGCELVIHRIADLLAHRTPGDQGTVCR